MRTTGRLSARGAIFRCRFFGFKVRLLCSINAAALEAGSS